MVDRDTIMANAARRDDRPIILSDSEDERSSDGTENQDVADSRTNPIISDLRKAAEIGEDFIQSAAFKKIRADQVSLGGEWMHKVTILTTIDEVYAITSTNDLQHLRGTLNEFEVSLLAGPSFSAENLFNSALYHVVDARIKGTTVGGPSLERCLAWLARAAQTSIQKIVPHGEIYPSAERYIVDLLTQPLLPKLEDSREREKSALSQLSHVFSLLSCLDLRLASTNDLSILLFAVCRLSIDRLVDASIHTKAINVINNILSGPEKIQRGIMLKFSDIMLDISDNYFSLLRCVELIRLCESAPSVCLPFVCALLIHKSERAELEPDAPDQMSEEIYISTYLNVLIDVMPAIFDECIEDRKTELCIISMIDMCLSRYVLEKASQVDIKKVLRMLVNRKRALIRTTRPDDALIEATLRFCLQRVEITLNNMEKMREI